MEDDGAVEDRGILVAARGQWASVVGKHEHVFAELDGAGDEVSPCGCDALQDEEVFDRQVEEDVFEELVRVEDAGRRRGHVGEDAVTLDGRGCRR